MRLAIVIFVLGVASCDQDSTSAGLSNILERLEGTWKEDSSKREGLNEFLEATGVGESFRKIAKKGIDWTNEKTITVNGNKVDMKGTNGPNLPGIYNNAYTMNLVADNTTIAEVDMKIMPTKVTFQIHKIDANHILHILIFQNDKHCKILYSTPGFFRESLLSESKEILWFLVQ